MLRETSQEKALRLAAVRPLEECAEIEARIRKAHLRTGHDPDGRPPRLERLVAHIGEHLFEGTLSVEGACKAVGIGDRAIGGELRAYAGCTVDELIDRLRIDTAYELVVGTDIRLGDICHLVGFRAYRTFTRSYSIFVGEPPRKTRKRHAGTPFDLPPDEPYDFRDFRSVRRLGEGEATPNELERLRRTLGDLYPDIFGDRKAETPKTAATTILPPVLDTEVLEKVVAEHQVWAPLANLSFAEQRRYVRQFPSWTPALFELLHQKSREEGRRDRLRGIELSQLALDSLDGNEGRLGERIHSLRAQGWAWLGNARRLALEFSAAQSALRKAESMLQVRDCRMDPFAGGIVYICKASLYMCQRRHQLAIDLFSRAGDLFEKASDVYWQVQSLRRRAAATAYAGRYSEVIPSLEEARALLGARADELLSFQVEFTTAVTLLRCADLESAKGRLEALLEKYSRVPRPMWRCQLQWLDANIDHGFGELDSAEAKYLLTWRDMRYLDEPLYKPLLLLDLAILYAEAGQLSKAAKLSTLVCPVFESINLYAETMASLRLLKSSAAQAGLKKETILQLRSALWCDPLVELAAKEGVRAITLTPGVNL